jgi:hypothetical protein
MVANFLHGLLHEQSQSNECLVSTLANDMDDVDVSYRIPKVPNILDHVADDPDHECCDPPNSQAEVTTWVCYICGTNMIVIGSSTLIE